jgi:hypothetical protein
LNVTPEKLLYAVRSTCSRKAALTAASQPMNFDNVIVSAALELLS